MTFISGGFLCWPPLSRPGVTRADTGPAICTPTPSQTAQSVTVVHAERKRPGAFTDRRKHPSAGDDAAVSRRRGKGSVK